MDIDFAGLEAQLDYIFGDKALLVQALTHGSSQQDPYEVRGTCYQRLEFLGDAVLDFLITRHLYAAHPGLSPGVLSDLRSAAVNNACFARSAVKNNLQRYLRHGSGELHSQISNFAKAVEEAGQDQLFGWEGVQGPKVPKVLGDLVESLAGAILVDSGFDQDKVWRVMERILSPLVTPSTLPLHPVRALHEVCQSKGLSVTWKKTQKSGKLLFTATGEIEVGNEVIIGTAMGQLKKAAKRRAARKILYALKSRGIQHPRWQAADENACLPSPAKVFQASEKRSLDGNAGGSGGETCTIDSGLRFREVELLATLGVNESDPTNEESKDHESSDENSIIADTMKKVGTTALSKALKLKSVGTDDSEYSIKMLTEKGCGRAKLNEISMARKWPPPVYELVSQEGQAHAEKFTFSAAVNVRHWVIKCVSNPMSTKKLAKDNAAVGVLSALHREFAA